MARIVWLSEADATPRTQLGGKAAGLGFLSSVGVTVPPGYVVTTQVFREAIGGALHGEVQRLADTAAQDATFDELEEVAAAVRQRIAAGTGGHPAEDDIAAGYRDLCEATGEDDVSVAVRSSAAGEDSTAQSFAGEHDSYLWVRGLDDLQERIRECWASLFTARAVSYRRVIGDVSDLAMAVVVQQMVDARAAGVAMTLNPANGDRSKVLIESTWGLGEPVVQGAVNPDRFLVDKVTREVIRREIPEKPTELVRNPDTLRGIVEREVDPKRREASSLTEAEITELVEVSRRIERAAGTPQDIEFTVVDGAARGQVLVVQCRPETVWSQRERPCVGGGKSALESVVSTLRTGGKR